MRRILLVAAIAALPASIAAQSSEFGTRGLGLPGRAESVRALATGGSFGLFDAGSSLNPAALADVTALTATFTGLQNFRSSGAGAISESGRDTRFPQITVAGPLGHRPFSIGVGYSNYTDRDFSVATTGSVVLQGVPVITNDTLSSRGGLNDISAGAAYRGAGWNAGFAVHIITGSARTDLRRTFSDSAYARVSQHAEISYAGAGFSVGVMKLVGAGLTLAVVARTDGTANVDRDSTRVNRVGLPASVGAGIRYRAGARLEMAGSAMYRTWSQADAPLIAGGGTGATNTFNASLGGEYVTDLRQPFRRPVRFGIHYTTLPFPVVTGGRPHEFGAAVGSGVRIVDPRSHRQVAGIDLALEHVWRSEGSVYRETAWLLALGVTVRP